MSERDAQEYSGTNLKVYKSLFCVRLVLRETLQNDSIGTLRENFDLAVGAANDRRHTLTGRVKLADIQYLILVIFASDVYEDRSRLAGLN